MATSDSSERSAQAEEWREIPGFPAYLVSNLGRVRSCYTRGSKRRLSTVWRILSCRALASGGYPTVTLCHKCKKSQRYIHELVAIAFIGPRPDGLEVNHIDGVKTNNHAGNLEYVTRSENERHSLRTGLRLMMEPLRGENHPKAKLTQWQADEIRRLYVAEKIGIKPLGRVFGVNQTVVRNILLGRSYVGEGRDPVRLRGRKCPEVAQ
jgi:hypothetical protein